MAGQADLVHEISTTTGTGSFTTSAVNGKQRFSDAGAFGTGVATNVFDYYASNRDVAGEWEHGTGHMSAAGTLVRDTIVAGSNGSSAVSFSAGTKDITNDIPAIEQVRSFAIRPQGRLTLQSGKPVMDADTTAAQHIYYAPYNGGQFVAIYDGQATKLKSILSSITDTVGLDLNLAASANWVSGSVYDLFYAVAAGTFYFGTGPAWTSTTARGTGAGTTELELYNGLWVNKNSMTLRYGAALTVTIPARQGTFLGSAYMTGSGATGMAFKPASTAGGTNNILGLSNAYNRIPLLARGQDSGNWTYATASYQPADNSTSNRISWLDCLGTSQIDTGYQCGVNATVSTVNAQVGMLIDAATGTPNVVGAEEGLVSGGILVTPSVEEIFLPQLGFHFVQAMERVGGGGTAAFNNAGGKSQALTVKLWG
jgi:hypothetical protein